MAKDEDKKPGEADDAFTDGDEKATTPAETVESKRSSAPPPALDDEASDEEEDDEASDEEKDEDEQDKPAAAAAPYRKPAAPYREPAGPPKHEEHGFAHVVSVKLLAAVLAALLFFTFLTVAATHVNLGGDWNLVVALVIATIKASLVVTFFMHLLWDKKFNLLVLLSGVLFVILFISLALTDRSEYQPLIDQREAAQAAQAQ